MYRLNNFVRVTCWGLLLCLFLSPVQGAKVSSADTLRIAVVYRVGDSGNRILGGVKSAVDTYRQTGGKIKVEVDAVRYLDESSGITKINEIFEKKSAELILGPSDSGVFVNVAKNEGDENKAYIPVVSPLVTALEGNKEGDWRFRTNIDVEARARAASDFLSHAGYQAIGVLYRSNEFGQRAAKAFKGQLLQPEEDYHEFPYQDDSELRDQVRKILESRPGAVGVFGRRYELGLVRRELEALNTGFFGYKPLLFSLTDTRILDLKGTYFVSLLGPSTALSADQTSIVWDEVRGLAYDTTWLVLKIAEQIDVPLNNKKWPASFQRRLFSYMLGPPQVELGFRTGMGFSDGKNLARPNVLTQTAKGVQLARADRSWRDLWKLGDWIEIRERRYGYAIWFNISLVTIIALWLTLADIRRRQEIRSGVLYFRRPVIALVLFNVVSAVTTLIVAAEMGVVSWNSVLAAAGVAIGHRALLTTTIFETAQGRALGFGRLYERTLASINERIMTTMHQSQSATINYVTYTNSLPNMRDLLINVYGFAQDKADSQARIGALQADIERATGTLAKQEVCARRLLQTMTWKQLQEKRIIPEYIEQGKLVDPIVILRQSVQFVLKSDEDLKDKVKNKIDEALEQLKLDSETGYEVTVKLLNEELEKAETERGRLYCRLRWLFTQWGFSLKKIREEGLLPEDFRVGRLRMRMGWFKKMRVQLHAKLRAVIERLQTGAALGTESESGGSNEPEEERRNDQRFDVEGIVQLVPVMNAGLSELKFDASIENVSTGGVRLEVVQDEAIDLPDSSNTVSIQILEGPLKGVMVEAQSVYEVVGNDVVLLGLKWLDLSEDMRERIASLAA